jgi:hypothetical protein
MGREDVKIQCSLLLLFRGITRYGVEPPLVLHTWTNSLLKTRKEFEVSLSKLSLSQPILTYSRHEWFPMIGSCFALWIRSIEQIAAPLYHLDTCTMQVVFHSQNTGLV